MSAFSIRDATLPQDREAFLSFILGSQHFEHAFEPDRRLDPKVAEDHLVGLLADVATRNGRIFVAEGPGGERLGWGVVHESDNDIYVVEDERRFGYISELFVVEAARGLGIGRAFIAACEDWGRACGLKLMMIGTLPGNVRARRIYEASGYRPYAIELRKYL
jgi:GNAT superfamily N-acetyltransferase